MAAVQAACAEASDDFLISIVPWCPLSFTFFFLLRSKLSSGECKLQYTCVLLLTWKGKNESPRKRHISIRNIVRRESVREVQPHHLPPLASLTSCFGREEACQYIYTSKSLLQHPEAESLWLLHYFITFIAFSVNTFPSTLKSLWSVLSRLQPFP